MITKLVNFLGRSVQPKSVAPLQQTKSAENPFANPFLLSAETRNATVYGKNRPVQGGYFAGYYNGKPNIVGTRLFVEV